MTYSEQRKPSVPLRLENAWEILKEIFNSGPDHFYLKARKYEGIDSAPILESVPDNVFVLVSSIGEAIVDINRNIGSDPQPLLDALIQAVREGKAEGYHCPYNKVARTDEDWFIRAGDVKTYLRESELPQSLQRDAMLALLFIKHSSKSDIAEYNKDRKDIYHCQPGWGRLNQR